jgi:cell volume regulation protein A
LTWQLGISIELLLSGVALLVLVSVLASKISDRFGVPALLLFLVIGMLAGSDGPGGIYFDDPALAQAIGTVALVLILFSGGLDTEWKSLRPVFSEAFRLATLGVMLTALITGLFAHLILRFPMLESLLVGAIVSSTDAAAVFSILRSRGVSLQGRLKPLLELESGSNDPMAVFLTIGMIRLLTSSTSPWLLLPMLVQQAVLGIATGLIVSRIAVFLVNRLRLGYEGLYPVLVFACVLLCFGIANGLGGSGFLAVYLLGLLMGRQPFVHKRSVMRFYDGIAWLMQISMFLILGLLVFPSRLIQVVGPAMLLALALMLVARPLSVFLGLLGSRFSLREKTLVSWVGLRGAVPIVLATYPLLARVSHADWIFNLVFFVVLTSVLLQGTSIPLVAKWLGVAAPLENSRPYPIEYVPDQGLSSELRELTIPQGCSIAGRAIVDMELPAELLIVLIARGQDFLVPNGNTVVRSGDKLLVLSEREVLAQVQEQLNIEGDVCAPNLMGTLPPEQA